MKLQAKFIPWLFGAIKNAGEKLPEILKEGGTGPVTTTTLTALIAPVAVPLAIITPPLVEFATEAYKDRAEPHAIAELFQETMLHAVEECIDSLEDSPSITEDDRSLLELWREGLSVAMRDNRRWTAMLNESLPEDLVNFGRIVPRNYGSYWPILRALLERWTDWFWFSRSRPGVFIAVDVPKQKLHLSSYLEDFLRVNFGEMVLTRFQPQVTAGAHEAAYRQLMLDAVAKILAAVIQDDHLRAITEFRGPAHIKRQIQLGIAEYRAIPYTGRETDLELLWSWLQNAGPASFFVITGRGGSGKTRLALRLLELIEDREPIRWRAGFLKQGVAPVGLLEQWNKNGRTLVVVDYAASHTSWLKEIVAALADQTCVGLNAIRFLLLERSADEKQGWYADLCRAAKDVRQDLFPYPVLRLSGLTRSGREELFKNSLKAIREFDLLHAPKVAPVRTLADDHTITKRLGREEMGDPLSIFMAAMVSSERGDLTALEGNRITLAREVANHEYRRIERIADAHGRNPFLLRHMAGMITLTRGLDLTDLMFFCRAEKQEIEPDASWTARELATVLSSEALQAGNDDFAVEGVQPDIVGEAFLVESFDPRPELTAAILRAAAKRSGNVVQTLVRLIQDFAGTDENQWRWALEELTSVLQHRATQITLPEFRDIDKALSVRTERMITAARNFYKNVVERTTMESPFMHLVASQKFAMYENTLGRHEVAFNIVNRLIGVWRELATKDPVMFFPGLAAVFDLYSTVLSTMHRPEEALEASEQAVSMYRQIVGADPTLLGAFAGALNNLSNRQTDMGEDEDALTSVDEAVAKYRELMMGDADTFLPELATSLLNKALTTVVVTGDTNLNVIEEAVRIWDGLVRQNADAFTGDLASAYGTWGHFLLAHEQTVDAAAKFGEGVRLYASEQAQGGRTWILLITDAERPRPLG